MHSGNRRMDKTVEGLDYDFTPPLDNKYECPICLFALREPHQTSCGHRFCKNCILKWIRESKKRCPIDNEMISEQEVFPDNFAKREILALKAHCPNHKNGCNVIADLRDIQDHEKICEYYFVPCKNKCGDLILKKDLDSHLLNKCRKRVVQCANCGEHVQADVMEVHTQECPMMTVKCKYCAVYLLRKEIPSHLHEDCPKAHIPCIFSTLGCSERMVRTDVEKHMCDATQQHLRLLCKTIESIKENSIKQDNLGDSDIAVNTCLHSETRTSSLSSESASELRELSLLDRVSMHTYLPSPSVTHSCSSNLAAGSVNTETSGKHSFPTESSVSFTKSGSSSGTSLRFPGDLAETTRLSDLVLSTSASTVEEILKNQSQKIALLEQQLLELKGALSSVERSLEEERQRYRLNIKEMESRLCNGVKIWHIREYSRLRREAQNGQTTVLHSDGFYTSFYGYKLCLRINLNGVDTSHGTHLSLFIHFMKGEFDDILDWPFEGKIVLTILDQNETVELRQHVMETLVSKSNLAAFQRPTTNRNHKGFGYMEFVPLSVIDSSALVKNDTLVIKAVVTITGHS